MSDLTRQLADELDVALAVPVAALLGLDLAEELRQRIADRRGSMAAILSGDDDAQAAELVIDIMGALWPQGVTTPSWWRTPLGRACARSIGADGSESVTRAVAAAMLGVHPGTVAQLVHRGTLDRHPDGGITRASVLMRLLAR